MEKVHEVEEERIFTAIDGERDEGVRLALNQSITSNEQSVMSSCTILCLGPVNVQICIHVYACISIHICREIYVYPYIYIMG